MFRGTGRPPSLVTRSVRHVVWPMMASLEATEPLGNVMGSNRGATNHTCGQTALNLSSLAEPPARQAQVVRTSVDLYEARQAIVRQLAIGGR